jgi:hypothetical protein
VDVSRETLRNPAGARTTARISQALPRTACLVATDVGLRSMAARTPDNQCGWPRPTEVGRASQWRRPDAGVDSWSGDCGGPKAFGGPIRPRREGEAPGWMSHVEGCGTLRVREPRPALSKRFAGRLASWGLMSAYGRWRRGRRPTDARGRDRDWNRARPTLRRLRGAGYLRAWDSRAATSGQDSVVARAGGSRGSRKKHSGMGMSIGACAILVASRKRSGPVRESPLWPVGVLAGERLMSGLVVACINMVARRTAGA